MIARALGVEIPMTQVTLDDMGWDHAATRGPESLTVEPSDDELRSAGRAVVAYAAEAVADEPDYFTSDPTLPFPAVPELFVGDATMLERFLRSSFWSRETMLALLRAGGGGQPVASGFLVQDLRGVAGESGRMIITLGAVAR